MYKRILSIFIALSIVLICIPAYASGLNNTSAEGDYDAKIDTIINFDGSDVNFLFLNGERLANNELVIRNNRSLIPLSFFSEYLNAEVSYSEKDERIIIGKSDVEIEFYLNDSVAKVNGEEFNVDTPPYKDGDTIFIPLRFVSENLGYIVGYSTGRDELQRKYLDTEIPLSPEDAIVRTFPNIMIDEKYDFDNSIDVKAAEKRVKEVCLEGLDNYSKTMLANLRDLNASTETMEKDLKGIEKSIHELIYIGEVSRFYKFTTGPYDVLYDRITQKIYFVIYSSYLEIKEVDVNDPGLFTPVYIVG